ncbi:unnamed protein product [Amoebophrya sp. A25]|nr:unnamed protein product [Amoebophrya sp. A25]|eukprot:GSA25T00013536001.1
MMLAMPSKWLFLRAGMTGVACFGTTVSAASSSSNGPASPPAAVPAAAPNSEAPAAATSEPAYDIIEYDDTYKNFLVWLQEGIRTNVALHNLIHQHVADTVSSAKARSRSYKSELFAAARKEFEPVLLERAGKEKQLVEPCAANDRLKVTKGRAEQLLRSVKEEGMQRSTDDDLGEISSKIQNAQMEVAFALPRKSVMSTLYVAFRRDEAANGEGVHIAEVEAVCEAYDVGSVQSAVKGPASAMDFPAQERVSAGSGAQLFPALLVSTGKREEVWQIISEPDAIAVMRFCGEWAYAKQMWLMKITGGSRGRGNIRSELYLDPTDAKEKRKMGATYTITPLIAVAFQEGSKYTKSLVDQFTKRDRQQVMTAAKSFLQTGSGKASVDAGTAQDGYDLSFEEYLRIFYLQTLDTSDGEPLSSGAVMYGAEGVMRADFSPARELTQQKGGSPRSPTALPKEQRDPKMISFASSVAHAEAYMKFLENKVQKGLIDPTDQTGEKKLQQNIETLGNAPRGLRAHLKHRKGLRKISVPAKEIRPVTAIRSGAYGAVRYGLLAVSVIYTWMALRFVMGVLWYIAPSYGADAAASAAQTLAAPGAHFAVNNLIPFDWVPEVVGTPAKAISTHVVSLFADREPVGISQKGPLRKVIEGEYNLADSAMGLASDWSSTARELAERHGLTAYFAEIEAPATPYLTGGRTGDSADDVAKDSDLVLPSYATRGKQWAEVQLERPMRAVGDALSGMKSTIHNIAYEILAQEAHKELVQRYPIEHLFWPAYAYVGMKLCGYLSVSMNKLFPQPATKAAPAITFGDTKKPENREIFVKKFDAAVKALKEMKTAEIAKGESFLAIEVFTISHKGYRSIAFDAGQQIRVQMGQLLQVVDTPRETTMNADTRVVSVLADAPNRVYKVTVYPLARDAADRSVKPVNIQIQKDTFVNLIKDGTLLREKA